MRALLAEVTLERLLDEEAQYFWVKEKLEVVAFKRGQEVFVYSSICPHMGAQMQYDSRENVLHCPWHGLKAETEKGCTQHSRFSKLRRYEAQVDGKALRIFE